MRRGRSVDLSRQEEGQWVCVLGVGGDHQTQNAPLHYIISYRRFFDYSGEEEEEGESSEI